MSWNEELGDSFDPQIRWTMQLRNNYSQDLTASCLWVTSCGCAPPFPFALWKSVLSNSFIDFDRVLSGYYSLNGETKESKSLGDFKVLGSTLKPMTTVYNISDWSIAWDRYSAAVRFSFPHRDIELTKYHEFILQTFTTSISGYAESVIQLDRTIRT